MFVIVVHVFKKPLGNDWAMNQLYVHGVVAVVVSYVAYFFMVVAYTVLYFECKKLHGRLKYSKLPITTQLANDMYQLSEPLRI